MNNYTNSDYLQHFGVKGMKWGVRKKYYNSDGSLNRLGQARQAYKQANKEYGKAYDKAVSYSARHPIGQWYGEKKQMSNSLWNDAVSKAEKTNRAQDRYKQVKRDIKRSNVKEYSNLYDKASSASDRADAKWNQVKEQRKKLGKNKISRVIASIKNTSPEAQKYNKMFEDASRASDRADAMWLKANQAYKNTGANAVSRVLNNILYADPSLKNIKRKNQPWNEKPNRNRPMDEKVNIHNNPFKVKPRRTTSGNI